MPLRTARESRQGRPRPSARRGGSGIRGLMMAHCSFVSSSRRAMVQIVAQQQGIYETASNKFIEKFWNQIKIIGIIRITHN
jgi:hypothetical protein